MTEMIKSRLNVIEQESSKASAADDLKCKDPDEKTAAEIIKRKTIPSPISPISNSKQGSVAHEDSAKHD